MNTALTIIGLAMLIFLVVFYLKRAKEKRKAWLEEREKIKEYGEKINEETRNKKNIEEKFNQKQANIKEESKASEMVSSLDEFLNDDEVNR